MIKFKYRGMSMSKKLENSLLMIWVVSFVATLGSLYFSEVRGYEPCELCWYQRIFMYPIVIIDNGCLHSKKCTNCSDNSCLCLYWWLYFTLPLWYSKADIPTRYLHLLVDAFLVQDNILTGLALLQFRF